MPTSDHAVPSHRAGGSEPPRRGRSRGTGARRRRPRRPLRTALLVVLAMAVLGTAGLGWVYLKLDRNVDTFDTDGVSKNRPAADTSKGENVLVIGSDARTNGNNALGGGERDDVGRSDTALLLHVYADHRHAVAVSIPRDTLVTIPPCRRPDGSWTKTQRNAMFNAAYSVGNAPEGNPACTQNTVENLTGLRVDHTVVMDFKGFAALTDVVGGVTVCLPKDVYERDLNPHRATRGKRLFSKGRQAVSGEKALDYVRIRHGMGDGSDIGRIKRQQAFMASLFTKVKSEGLTPTKLLPLADAATKSLTVDPGLGTVEKLVSFAVSLKDIDLHNTKFVTIPWRYQGSRVAIVEPDASELWAALRADRTVDGEDAGATKGGTASARPPGARADTPAKNVDVAVYNGTTTEGLAARAASTLTQHGFTVTRTANASAQDHSTTVVEFDPRFEAQARQVAGLFPGAEFTAVPGAGITVVLGRNYTAPGAGAQAPNAVPPSVANSTRSADDDPCSDLTFGSGG
ncbi:LCP family protein [Streptomyces sp. NPDC059169]|uniref:LCP family protein n=1 Tax=unclassified Streptomyces TaxID=2593676 RepID=UPI0036AFF71B